MDITEFSIRALNDEVQMIEDFNFLNKKSSLSNMICIYRPMLKLMKFWSGVND